MQHLSLFQKLIRKQYLLFYSCFQIQVQEIFESIELNFSNSMQAFYEDKIRTINQNTQINFILMFMLYQILLQKLDFYSEKQE